MPYTNHTKGIIISYIIAQFSVFIIYPLNLLIFPDLNDLLIVSVSAAIGFMLGLICMLWIIRNELNQLLQTPFLRSFNYALLGLWVAIIGQMLLSVLISQFVAEGLNQETEQYMLKMSEVSILFLIIPIIIGPILEELVFRYAILGSFMKRMKTTYAVLLSSLLFGLIHFSLTNLVIYVFCGIVFSVIYIKTNSILTSIMAHVFMNAFVMVMFLIGI